LIEISKDEIQSIPLRCDGGKQSSIDADAVHVSGEATRPSLSQVLPGVSKVNYTPPAKSAGAIVRQTSCIPKLWSVSALVRDILKSHGILLCFTPRIASHLDTTNISWKRISCIPKHSSRSTYRKLLSRSLSRRQS
jgi:hypothetical protein